MPALLDDLAPPPPPAPEPPDGGGAPPPPEPARVRFWERPGFRHALWVVAVIVALILIGVVFPPNFWRF